MPLDAYGSRGTPTVRRAAYQAVRNDGMLRVCFERATSFSTVPISLLYTYITHKASERDALSRPFSTSPRNSSAVLCGNPRQTAYRYPPIPTSAALRYENSRTSNCLAHGFVTSHRFGTSFTCSKMNIRKRMYETCVPGFDDCLVLLLGRQRPWREFPYH